jgi:hypothetical protein
MIGRIGAVLALILLAVLAATIWHKFEKIPIAQHGQPTMRPQAAALALFERWQKSPRRLTSSIELFPLPATDTLLIVERTPGTMPTWQQDALLEWVEAGGRLVTHALPLSEDAWDDGELSDADIRNHDPLLYRLGITAWRDGSQPHRAPASPAFGPEDGQLERNFRMHCIAGEDDDTCIDLTCGDFTRQPVFAWLDIEDVAQFQLEMDPTIDLLHRDLFDEVDEEDVSLPESGTNVMQRGVIGGRDSLLQLRSGVGDVWVLSDMAIFKNRRLHHLDHAALLEYISQTYTQIWWATSVDVPPLSSWAWQRAWPLILSLLILLLVFLWQHMPRRGVILSLSERQPHDFTDHLRAAAALLWRINQKRPLLEPLQRDVLRRLATHPGGTDPQRCKQLAAELSGLSPELVYQALHAVPDNDAALQQQIALLQHLRQSL